LVGLINFELTPLLKERRFIVHEFAMIEVYYQIVCSFIDGKG